MLIVSEIVRFYDWTVLDDKMKAPENCSSCFYITSRTQWCQFIDNSYLSPYSSTPSASCKSNSPIKVSFVSERRDENF